MILLQEEHRRRLWMHDRADVCSHQNRLPYAPSVKACEVHHQQDQGLPILMAKVESTQQNRETFPLATSHHYLPSPWALTVNILSYSTTTSLPMQVLEVSVIRRRPIQPTIRVMLGVPVALLWQLTVRTHPPSDQAFQILFLELYRINIRW